MTSNVLGSDNGVAYLSAGWFDLMEPIIRLNAPPANATRPDLFAVQYVLSDGSRHHQLFLSGRLVHWRPGAIDRADLVIHRSVRVDEGDLLGRLGSTTVNRESAFTNGGSAFDALATPGVLCRDVGIRVDNGFVVSAELLCHDGPFGPLRALLRAGPDVITIVVEPSTGAVMESPDVIIGAPYASLLEWLHGDAILGHLMHRGASIEGDLLALSALDGVVSAEPRGWAPGMICSPLAYYARVRNDPANLTVLDLIDEQTGSPASSRDE